MQNESQLPMGSFWALANNQGGSENELSWFFPHTSMSIMRQFLTLLKKKQKCFNCHNNAIRSQSVSMLLCCMEKILGRKKCPLIDLFVLKLVCDHPTQMHSQQRGSVVYLELYSYSYLHTVINKHCIAIKTLDQAR